jgi:hypothetical protein
MTAMAHQPVTDDGSVADGSAILEVKSINHGFYYHQSE